MPYGTLILHTHWLYAAAAAAGIIGLPKTCQNALLKRRIPIFIHFYNLTTACHNCHRENVVTVNHVCSRLTDCDWAVDVLELIAVVSKNL